MSESLTLSDWAREYARHRYRARGIAFDLKEHQTPFDFTISTPSKNEGYIICENLHSLQLPRSEALLVIITSNTPANVDHLIARWNDFAQHERLWIVFANPKSSKDRYWSLHPHLHAQIADIKNLKAGLLSLASMVDWA